MHSVPLSGVDRTGARPPPSLTDDLRAQQLQSHLVHLPWGASGAALAALFFVVTMHDVVPQRLLLGWLGAVYAVLALRFGMWGWQRGRPCDRHGVARRLFGHRLCFAASGILWGLAATLPLQATDVLHLAAMVLIMSGTAAGAFAMTSYDLRAALVFGVPVFAMISWRLWHGGGRIEGILSAAALVELSFLALSANSAQRFWQRFVALRVSESDHVLRLQRSEELLARTGASAGIGGWEFEPESGALRLTAQTRRLHALDPSSEPSLDKVHACYEPADQQRLRDAFDLALNEGQAFSLELPLRTAQEPARWVRFEGRAIGEPAMGRWLSGVVQDITESKHTRMALDDQRDLLRLLIDTTREGYWFINPEGVTTDLNPAMCGILGRPREAVIGRSVYDVVDAANAEIFRNELGRREQGESGGYEITLVRPDGSRIDCFNQATPIFDARGVHLGSIGMWTDITRRKQAEAALRASGEELARQSHGLRLTLDSISQGIIGLDGDGRVNVYNRRALELLDLPESLFATGCTLQALVQFQADRGDFGPDRAFFDAEMRQRVTFGNPRTFPETYVRGTRQGRRLEVRSRHLPDGGLVRTYADVTAHVDALRALLAAKDDAERANRAKSQFLSNMSHELRTPLNAVLGFGQLLGSDSQTPLQGKQAAYVDEMMRGARHLLSLITELLDLAQIEAGRMRISLEPVRVQEVLDECLALLRPLSGHRGVDVRGLEPGAALSEVLVYADRTRLKQVLLNLLSNAIKYSSDGGRIHVSGQVLPDAVRIEVRDDGPGLDPALHDRLFRPFERLGAEATDVEGAGLGLVLSKRLMEAMSGAIGLDTTPGEGTCFWISLSRAAHGTPEVGAASVPAEEANPDGPWLGPTRAQRHKVLYIEDNPVNVILMDAMLARIPGLDVIPAPLPELGLRLAVEQRPDLILLDIQLPGMDGFEVMRRLREDPRSRPIPVIAVSANAMPSDIAQGLEAGFARYLTKPLDLTTLIAAVRAALPVDLDKTTVEG